MQLTFGETKQKAILRDLQICYAEQFDLNLNIIRIYGCKTCR